MLGNVGIRENGKVQIRAVELPEFDRLTFSNRYLRPSELPPGLTEQSDRNLLFETNDPRFAYVHLLFHANRMLEHFASRLPKLGIPPMEPLIFSFRLEDVPVGKICARYTCTSHEISFRGSPLIDESTISHEIGHALHAHLHHDAFVRGEEDKRLSVETNALHTAQEATADILAALFLNTAVIEPASDGPRDLSQTVTKNGIKTIRTTFEEALADPEFRKAWPANVELIQKALAGQHPVHVILDCQDPYGASRLFSGPIWRADVRFGGAKIERLLLLTLQRQLHRSLSHAADEILLTCHGEGESEVATFLDDEFRAAGLLPARLQK